MIHISDLHVNTCPFCPGADLWECTDACRGDLTKRIKITPCISGEPNCVTDVFSDGSQRCIMLPNQAVREEESPCELK